MSEKEESVDITTTHESVVSINETNVQENDEYEPFSKKSKTSDESYPFAKSRGIKIFSQREIGRQDAAMTKEYWKFWNETAEELCSDGAYNKWGKRDIKLYIDAVWIVYKTKLLEPRERELRDNLTKFHDSYGSRELPAKLRTEDENLIELLSQLHDSTANLTELNLELSKYRGKLLNIKERAISSSFTKEMKQQEVEMMMKEVAEKEKNLYDGMAEVKKDQDSLKKSLNKLGNIIEKTKRKCPQFHNVTTDEALN